MSAVGGVIRVSEWELRKRVAEEHSVGAAKRQKVAVVCNLEPMLAFMTTMSQIPGVDPESDAHFRNLAVNAVVLSQRVAAAGLTEARKDTMRNDE